MVKLCGFRLSNYHNKVRLVLLEKGIPHEEETNHYPSQDENFRKRSPMGKAPFLETDPGVLCESAVICEYLEDSYPDKPLFPQDPFARSKTREFLQILELHIELVVRRVYGAVLYGQEISENVKKEVSRDLEKGVRALTHLVKFSPYILGSEFSIADCAAVLHLPIASMVSKAVLGRDFLEGLPQLHEYLQLVGERPFVKQVNEGRREAMEARATSRSAPK